MLLHLAMMLSKVSGWGLPSDDKAYDSSHESVITGEVDGARDRRRLWPQPMASSCDGWSVCSPHRAFLPRLTVPMPSCLRFPRLFLAERPPPPRGFFVRCDSIHSCDHDCDSTYLCDSDDDDVSFDEICGSSCDTSCDSQCGSNCNTGCSACPSGQYSAASTSLVAPHAPWPKAARSAHARAPCRRTRTTGFRAALAPHAPSHTNRRCMRVRAQGRGRTFAILTAPSRRPRARRRRRRLLRRRQRPRPGHSLHHRG